MVRFKVVVVLEERVECGFEFECKLIMVLVVDILIFVVVGFWLVIVVVFLGFLFFFDFLVIGGWSVEVVVECVELMFVGGVGNVGLFIWGDVWLDILDCIMWLLLFVLVVFLCFCFKLLGVVLGSVGLVEGGVGRVRVWFWGFFVCLDV